MVGEPVRIGCSFWGFLGPGVTGTPDGGRGHRRTLIDGIISAGYEIVFLQANRDLAEARHDLRGHYPWDGGLPRIHALFLEWRWPIPGRNTTPCGTRGHTCDLHHQDQLLDHYTRRLRLPAVLWDKDLRLPATDDAELIAACLDRLPVFRLSHQVTALDLILRKLAGGPPAFLRPAQPVSR